MEGREGFGVPPPAGMDTPLGVQSGYSGYKVLNEELTNSKPVTNRNGTRNMAKSKLSRKVVVRRCEGTRERQGCREMSK